MCLIPSLMLVPGVTLHAEHLPIKTYTIADGLANDAINRIVRDSRGYLWFCTKEGLSRFDGYTFTNYGRTQGLPGENVNDLLETREGIYLVATDAGVFRFNAGGRAVPQENSETIAEPNQSKKAGASPDEALFIPYYLSGEQKPYQATVLLESHAGVIWCGTSLGVYQLDRSSGQRFFSFMDIGMSMKPGEPTVQSLLQDHTGTLWVGTMEGGLYRHLPDGHTEHYTSPHDLPSNAVPALLEDREGHLWVGTRGGLCLLVSNPKPNQPIIARKFATKDGLAANQVYSLFESGMDVCGSVCSAV